MHEQLAGSTRQWRCGTAVTAALALSVVAAGAGSLVGGGAPRAAAAPAPLPYYGPALKISPTLPLVRGYVPTGGRLTFTGGAVVNNGRERIIRSTDGQSLVIITMPYPPHQSVSQPWNH